MKALLLYSRKAGNQQFPQASLIAILQERQHEIRTARLKACKTENSKM
jgi:menaquinone-dependent protoporphyrinogen IX oxidase